jgi:hypothetical protein
MKEVRARVGGRPFANDDILTLQAEVYDAIGATFAGAPAMVLSGCNVDLTAANRGNIRAGYIWLAGEVLRYPGANNVAIPAEVVAGPLVESDLRAYQTGGSQACMQELSLLTQDFGTAPAGTERVHLHFGGATRTYAKWVESQTRQLGDLQDSIAPAPGTICDPSGRGWPDGPRAGWALANGQNGTKDLRALFRVAYSDKPGDYDTVGKTGGFESVTLTVEQIPAHNHTNGDFQYLLKVGKDSVNSNTDFSASEPTLTSAGKALAAGGGLAHENRPPYFVTVVWQWIGLNG